MTELGQLVLNGLVTGSIIALAAVGVSLVYGILRIVNFAHGDYLTFGAYMAVLANLRWHQSMVVSTLFAVLAAALLSVGLEFGLWRPLRRRGAKFMSLFIASIGLALVLRHLIFLVAHAQFRAFDVNVFQVYDLHGLRLSKSQAVAIGIALGAIAAIGGVLARSRLGKSMRALSDDAALASISGIDTDRVVVWTWVLAGALAGVGGVMEGLVQSSFDPNLGFTLLLPIFAAVVLGGIGSAYGALVGGFALGVVMEVSTWTELPHQGVDPVYKPVVAFAVLILALLVRPQGVFGRARIL